MTFAQSCPPPGPGSAAVGPHPLAGFENQHQQQDVQRELDDVFDQAQAAEHHEGLPVGDVQPQRGEQEVEEQHHVELAQHHPPQLDGPAVQPQPVQHPHQDGAEGPAREVGAVGAQDVAQQVGDDARKPRHPGPAEVADGGDGQKVEADFQQLGDRNGELVEHQVDGGQHRGGGQGAGVVKFPDGIDPQAGQGVAEAGERMCHDGKPSLSGMGRTRTKKQGCAPMRRCIPCRRPAPEGGLFSSPCSSGMRGPHRGRRGAENARAVTSSCHNSPLVRH